MTSATSTAQGHSVTWTDFIALAGDDRRELIEGHLVEVEVPTELHEWVIIVLAAALFDWSRSHGGRPLGSGYKVRISDSRGVMPDLQYYRKGRPANPPTGLETGAPDLVVEVISRSSVRYDRVTKLGWYGEIGVPEYWIVDPEAKTVERLCLENDSYRIADAVGGEDRFEPSSFPGLSVDLTILFTVPE